jgi:hypothetical protein
MKQTSVSWILGAIAVLGLSAGTVLFGNAMTPPMAEMKSKLGTLAPLYITWGMIWIAVAMGVALAAFMIAIGLGVVRDAE